MEGNSPKLLAIIAIITMLKICAVQAQDNSPPVWDETSLKILTDGISEDTKKGTFLLQLKCTDPDGDFIQYSLLGGNAVSVTFDGKVTLAVPVDFDTTDSIGYDLIFGCKDLSPSGSDIHQDVEIAVEFTLNDANDIAPEFKVDALEGYSFAVSEFNRPGFVLKPTIQIDDGDRGPNAKLSHLYLICDSPFPDDLKDLPETSVATCEKFSLNYTEIDEGKYLSYLKLKGDLDFETRRVYSSKVVAIDNPDDISRRLSTTINVQINVEDAQDTDPLFVNLGESTTVLEEGDEGTAINLAISARDGDLGDKRPLKIVIINDPEDAFTVDPSVEVVDDPGVYAASLRVKNGLDRESINGAYNFVVKVIELDKTTLAETTATATATYSVQVGDIDDQPPTFEFPQYNVDVTEMEYTNESVQLTGLRIVCVDNDVGQNARYRVNIVSQSHPNVFSISPNVPFSGTAILFLKVNDVNFLDYDKPEYRSQTVVLEARSDGGFPMLSSTTTVSINLVDINDNAPKFEQSSFDLAVSEDITVNQLPYKIRNIKADDSDSGNNGKVLYRLEGGTNNKFSIDKVTGDLYLTGLVDYETTPLYVFLVYAVDQAENNRQQSQVQVSVRVLNVNDKQPEFDEPFYQTSVNEGELDFLTPVVFTAKDNEEGSLPIVYTIKNGQTPDQAFNLNRQTGELSLVKPLMYDDTGFHVIQVEASDQGSPPMTQTATCTVSVIDRNNFPPVIFPKIYRATVSELVEPGTYIDTVLGDDEDQGEFGTVSYRIVSGGFDNFEIDSVTGRITIHDPQNFDYDQDKSFVVGIIGSDGGAPQLTDTATLIVNITDANNKAPVFAESYYQNVHERNDPGHPILTVTATDLDSTKKLAYSILADSIVGRNGAGNALTSIFPYNYKDAVEMNRDTGVLTIKNKLDKQQLLTLSFKVQVEDLNAQTPNQVAETRVALTVVGEANTELTFDTIDQIFVNEGSEKGYGITTVVARDPTDQNGVITYSQIGDSPFFEVVPTTGEVRIKNQLDYEKDPREHVVMIKGTAKDGIRSVSTSVTIKISDDNDNPPKFSQAVYNTQVREDAPSLTSVANILAVDVDTSSFGPVVYKIAGGLDSDHFELYEANQGVDVLVARGVTLNYNNRDLYELDIIAQDNPERKFSNIRLFSSVKLKIEVIDTNNHGPEFLDAGTARRFAVAETASLGKNIGRLIATDSDFGENGEVSYFLETIPNDPSSVQALQLFTIGQVSGVVSVGGSLIGFGGNTYKLRVFARDGGNPFLSSTLDIQIEVLQTENNDGNPVWHRPANNFVFFHPEEVVGQTIKDRSGNEDIFRVSPRTGNGIAFRLSNRSEGADSFDINVNTGVITVVKSLDREIKESYKLLVYAEDTSDPLKIRTGRQIVVQLTDKNDNLPTFMNVNNYPSCGQPIDQPLEVSFFENVPVDTLIYQLSACDPDLNDPIYYYLYNGDDDCKAQNDKALAAVNVTEDGKIVTNIVVDYEEYQMFSLCVIAQETPGSQGRKTNDNVAKVIVHVLDMNDNKPEFPKPTVTAVMLTDARDYPVVVLDAVDRDGRGLNTPVYTIVDTKFFAAGENTFSSPGRAFVVKNNELIPDPPRGKTYGDFAGGRFVLTIRAQDPVNSTNYDTQTVTVYIHEQGNAMKVILGMKPQDGFMVGGDIVRRLNDVASDHTFRYLHVSVHTDKEGIDETRTDVCFIVVNSISHNILNILELVNLLDRPQYQQVLDVSDFKALDRGKCYPSASSEEQVKWRDLWWVLVVVGIFIGVCCLIFIFIIFALYRRYKRYMTTEKTYLVPQ